MSSYNLMLGNCLDTLKTLEDNSVDSIVTDPPYGLAFMGKKWDYDVPSTEIWEECFRVLKPGGHLLAFAGTRTQHRMCVRIEDAGFEIRDMIAWVYGSGFPKSMEIGKQIDKAAGAKREVVGVAGKSGSKRNSMAGDFAGGEYMATAPATEEAKQWQGWGTALKPALEPITLARKPVSEKTVARNVLKWGTGGINIDECRVGDDGGGTHCNNRDENGKCMGHNNAGRSTSGQTFHADASTHNHGRFPANFIHDGSDEVLAVFPQKVSKSTGGKGAASGLFDNESVYGNFSGESKGSSAGGFGDCGTPARFFYCAKASKKDREEGLDNATQGSQGAKGNGLARVCASCGTPQLKAADCKCESKEWVNPSNRKNFHPTVKPTMLMQYLCRLITPKGGVVLDPFMGSGSTGKAAMIEGFNFIGCELSQEYYDIAEARIQAAKNTKSKELPL